MPRRSTMKMSPRFAGIVGVCTLSGIFAVASATPPAAKPPSTTQPAMQEVGSVNLEKQVGKRIVVHTRLGTVRNGILKKVTQTSIDMKLDSGAELNVPIGTIRSVTIPVAPADPLYPTPVVPSAKKN